MNQNFPRLMFVICVASGGGCLSEDPDVATDEQALGRGAVMPRNVQEFYGVVMLNNNNGTGVMLDNTLGLSAGHVVANKSATVGFAGDKPIRASQTYSFTAPDLAVFRLDQPLTINGSTRGFVNFPIGETKVGDLVYVFGGGWSTETGHDQGTVRSGSSMVTGFAPPYTVMQSAPTTIQPGDSGGPSFSPRDELVGIHGIGWYNCDPCEADDITLWPMFGGIVAVSEPWTSFPTNLLNILSQEIRANAEPLYDDTGPWYGLASEGNDMCTNRSDQVAGHFTGFSSSGRYGLACTGIANPNVTVSPSSPSDRAAVGFTMPYTAIGWAQANRYAQQICQNPLIGTRFLAGYYTGDVDPQGNYKLVCHRNGALFQATANQLKDSGYSGKRVDDASYNDAMRAAHTYCTRQKITLNGVTAMAKTGFMTGKTSSGTYEIYCEL